MAMIGQVQVFALILAGTSISWAPPTQGDVTVEQKPVVVERKTFDPAHRPTEMPALQAGEAAVTESQFDCSADLTYKVVERKTADAGYTVLLRVQAVRVTLSLKVIVWLPGHAPVKLVSHEEGHREIDQRVFEHAKDGAEREARRLDGQVLQATAADYTSAEQNATQSAADDFCRRFLSEIGQRAGRVNDEYDRLTEHGKKAKPGEDEAIREALKCELQGDSRQ